MPLWTRNTAPTGVYVGDVRARGVYLGDIELWNGDVPVEMAGRPACGRGTVPVPELAAGFITELAGAVGGTGSAPTPAVVAGVGAIAPAAVGVGSVPVPAVSGAVRIVTQTATGVGSIPVPNVGEAEIATPAATGMGSVPAPAVGGGVTVAGAAAAGVGSASAPAASAGATVAAPTATSVGSAPAPEFSSGIIVSDDFNRADSSTLGANYTVIGSSPTLTSNRAQAGSPASYGQSISYMARHNTVLLTDTQQVVFVPIAATSGSDASLGGGVFLRGTTAGEFVCVSVDANKAYINIRTGGAFVNKASSAAGATPTSVRITADGATYAVYINGSSTPAVTWTDSGGLIGIGAANRSVGVICNGYNNFSVTRGWSIDSFTARDGIAA